MQQAFISSVKRTKNKISFLLHATVGNEIVNVGLATNLEKISTDVRMAIGKPTKDYKFRVAKCQRDMTGLFDIAYDLQLAGYTVYILE
jgi:hypothetical protein